MSRVAAAFGGALAILVLGILVLIAEHRANVDRGWVAHTHDVIEQAQQVLADAEDAETGQRGYLLTGESSYLEPHRAALGRLREDTTRLRALTADNPAQQRNLDRLSTHVTAKLGELDRTIAARAAGLGASIALVREGRGKAEMDSIRAAIAAIQTQERVLLGRRESVSAASNRMVEWVVILGTLGAIIAAIFSMRFMSIYADGQEHLARLLAAQNDRLQQQAEELEMQNEMLAEQATEVELQRDQLQDQTVELETINEQLLEQTDAAVAASAAKSDFLAAVSHELRTPLNAIDGYSDLLLLGVRGELSDSQKSDVERIRRSSRHLLSLINQVLNTAKIEAGDVDLSITTFDARDVLLDAEVLIKPQIQAKNVTWRIVSDGKHAMARGDTERTKQIVLNLLSNAVKFTDRHGRIDASCSDGDGKTVRIQVADTGRGIPADKLSSIFEPFTQVDRNKTPDAERGIGLGLSISRTLARAMGGDITVESEVGKGSVFTLTLPAAS